MTIEEFNLLVEQSYEAALEFVEELQAAYEMAYARQTSVAADRFRVATEVVTAAWTPPVVDSLTSGMNDQEKDDTDAIRDEAALAIAAVLAAAGVAVSSPEFLAAISARAQTNFEQEILRKLRAIVSQSFDAGLSSEATAQVIREQLPEVIPASAQMLAQTELTALVNERSLVAANKQFQGEASKTWLTVKDNRVRVAHAQAEGQTVPISQPFQIGGSSLMYPGDPSGPLRLVARCRCRLSFSNDPAAVVASAQEDTLNSMELHNDAGETVGTLTIYPSTTSNHFALTKATLTSAVTVTVTDDTETEPVAAMADGAPWRCLLAVEGVQTEDGRYLDPGSITWRDLPLSLMAMDETTEGGHLGAKVAGRIDAIWRDGNDIWGSGVFNSEGFGAHISELVSNQSLRGNSIDLAIIGYEYRDPETGIMLEDDALMDAVLSGNPVVFAVTDGVIMASTVCPTPAIAEANIILASGVPTISFYTPWEAQDTLTASAAGMVPLHPPAAWFEKPSLNEPTALTITPEGRVFGHAALWDSCHIGEPSGPGICVPPPRSGMNYEIFHHGACLTEEGHDVVVGQLTLGTLHAGRDLGWRETIEHYENSGLAFADVHAYEDRFGIVVAGALRPDVPAVKVREAKAGALSGDWRTVIGRGLEFLAALVVNVPGFPIPRPEARIVASAAGEEEVLALVAAGMVPPAVEVEGLSRREYLRQIRMLTDV